MPTKQKTDLGTKVQVQLEGREFKFHLVKQKTYIIIKRLTLVQSPGVVKRLGIQIPPCKTKNIHNNIKKTDLGTIVQVQLKGREFRIPPCKKKNIYIYRNIYI